MDDRGSDESFGSSATPEPELVLSPQHHTAAVYWSLAAFLPPTRAPTACTIPVLAVLRLWGFLGVSSDTCRAVLLRLRSAGLVGMSLPPLSDTATGPEDGLRIAAHDRWCEEALDDLNEQFSDLSPVPRLAAWMSNDGNGFGGDESDPFSTGDPTSLLQKLRADLHVLEHPDEEFDDFFDPLEEAAEVFDAPDDPACDDDGPFVFVADPDVASAPEYGLRLPDALVRLALTSEQCRCLLAAAVAPSVIFDHPAFNAGAPLATVSDIGTTDSDSDGWFQPDRNPLRILSRSLLFAEDEGWLLCGMRLALAHVYAQSALSIAEELGVPTQGNAHPWHLGPDDGYFFVHSEALLFECQRFLATEDEGFYDWLSFVAPLSSLDAIKRFAASSSWRLAVRLATEPAVRLAVPRERAAAEPLGIDPGFPSSLPRLSDDPFDDTGPLAVARAPRAGSPAAFLPDAACPPLDLPGAASLFAGRSVATSEVVSAHAAVFASSTRDGLRRAKLVSTDPVVDPAVEAHSRDEETSECTLPVPVALRGPLRVDAECGGATELHAVITAAVAALPDYHCAVRWGLQVPAPPRALGPGQPAALAAALLHEAADTPDCVSAVATALLAATPALAVEHASPGLTARTAGAWSRTLALLPRMLCVEHHPGCGPALELLAAAIVRLCVETDVGDAGAALVCQCGAALAGAVAGGTHPLVPCLQRLIATQQATLGTTPHDRTRRLPVVARALGFRYSVEAACRAGSGTGPPLLDALFSDVVNATAGAVSAVSSALSAKWDTDAIAALCSAFRALPNLAALGTAACHVTGAPPPVLAPLLLEATAVVTLWHSGDDAVGSVTAPRLTTTPPAVITRALVQRWLLPMLSSLPATDTAAPPVSRAVLTLWLLCNSVEATGGPLDALCERLLQQDWGIAAGVVRLLRPVDPDGDFASLGEATPHAVVVVGVSALDALQRCRGETKDLRMFLHQATTGTGYVDAPQHGTAAATVSTFIAAAWHRSPPCPWLSPTGWAAAIRLIMSLCTVAAATGATPEVLLECFQGLERLEVVGGPCPPLALPWQPDTELAIMTASLSSRTALEWHCLAIQTTGVVHAATLRFALSTIISLGPDCRAFTAPLRAGAAVLSAEWVLDGGACPQSLAGTLLAGGAPLWWATLDALVRIMVVARRESMVADAALCVELAGSLWHLREQSTTDVTSFSGDVTRFTEDALRVFLDPGVDDPEAVVALGPRVLFGTAAAAHAATTADAVVAAAQRSVLTFHGCRAQVMCPLLHRAVARRIVQLGRVRLWPREDEKPDLENPVLRLLQRALPRDIDSMPYDLCDTFISAAFVLTHRRRFAAAVRAYLLDALVASQGPPPPVGLGGAGAAFVAQRITLLLLTHALGATRGRGSGSQTPAMAEVCGRVTAALSGPSALTHSFGDILVDNHPSQPLGDAAAMMHFVADAAAVGAAWRGPAADAGLARLAAEALEPFGHAEERAAAARLPL